MSDNQPSADMLEKKFKEYVETYVSQEMKHDEEFIQGVRTVFFSGAASLFNLMGEAQEYAPDDASKAMAFVFYLEREVDQFLQGRNKVNN